MVGVLHAQQLEILFPVRPLLVERYIAEADLDPADRAVVAQAGIGHVAEIFVARHRTATESTVLDCAQQRRFTAWPDAGGDEVAHRTEIVGDGRAPRTTFVV